MPPRFLADDLQAEDILIEHFSPVEVIDVDGGLDEMLNARFVHDSSHIEEHDLAPLRSTYRQVFLIADGGPIARRKNWPLRATLPRRTWTQALRFGCKPCLIPSPASSVEQKDSDILVNQERRILGTR